MFSYTPRIKFNLPMSAEALSKIYHDPKDPGSLGGVERLLKRGKQLMVPDFTRQLSRNTYEASRPIRCTNRRAVGSPEITPMWRRPMLNWQLQADLADMQGIFKQNGEMRYLFTVIDVFSKFAYQFRSTPKTQKQSRGLSGKCS